jgi:creatinine amidohydrolase
VPEDTVKGMRAGDSVFHRTIVDMTYVEYVDAIRPGGIGLWGIGVIEEHGPHLPLGTDIYLAHAQTTKIQEQLTERGSSA